MINPFTQETLFIILRINTILWDLCMYYTPNMSRCRIICEDGAA